MRLFLIVAAGVLLNGCALVEGGMEVGKTIWGSSTRALEHARANAITKTYQKGYWETLRASLEFLEQKGYVIFKKDEIKGYIIVIGVKGSVNTTEVGVFFLELGDQTRIEVSSLSTNAKRLVSKALFHGLDINFGLIPPDAPEATTHHPLP